MVTAAAALLGLVGLGAIAFGLYAMIRGGRDGGNGRGNGRNSSGGASGDRGGLGPIPERGIHLLAGLRIAVFGVVCLAAAAFALTRLS